MNIQEAPLDSIDWNFTLQTLQEGRCIIFLGPELFTNNQNKKLGESLSDYLQVGKNEDIEKYYQAEELFLFKNNGAQTKTYYKIKNFYQQSFPETETLLKKIAQLPASFIVNLTPDKHLVNTFQQLNLPVKSDFYWKNHTPKSEVKLPSIKKPLVYNLFGSIDQQESLILTHNDLFDYFSSIFGERGLPKDLRHKIHQAHNLIFLGIPFDKWYLQLILRILSLHNDSDFMRYAANESLTDELIELCKNQFNINFFPNNIKAFIDTLHRHCQEKNLLKNGSAQQLSIIEKITGYIIKDDLPQAFTQLKTFLEELGEIGRELLEDTVLLFNRHNRIQKRLLRGIINNQDADLEENKIRESLIFLVKEVKELD